MGGSRSAADTLWDSWHTLARAQSQARKPVPAGLVMDPVNGATVRLSHFNKFLKEVFANALRDRSQLHLLTSYSLRRAGPTLASAIRLQWEARVISGGWVEGSERGRNRMPIVYNAQRREAEMCARLYMSGVLRVLPTELEPPVQWEHVRCWARSTSGQDALLKLEAEASRVVAQTTGHEIAESLPRAVMEELRRRKFRRLALAPRGGHPERMRATPGERAKQQEPCIELTSSSDGELGDDPALVVMSPRGQTRTGVDRVRQGKAEPGHGNPAGCCASLLSCSLTFVRRQVKAWLGRRQHVGGVQTPRPRIHGGLLTPPRVPWRVHAGPGRDGRRVSRAGGTHALGW